MWNLSRAKIFKLVLIAFILGIVAGRWLNWPPAVWICLVAASAWIIIFIKSEKAESLQTKIHDPSTRVEDGARRLASAKRSGEAGSASAFARATADYPPLIYPRAKAQGLLRRRVKIISLIILFFIFGAIRYQLSWPTFGPNRLEFYNSQKTIFTGRVIRETTKNTSKELIVEIKSINNDAGSGRALIRVPLYSPYGQGQNLLVACKIIAPQNYNRFNFVGYLAKDSIFSVCYYPDSIELMSGSTGIAWLGWLTTFRTKAQALINKNFSEPQGALISSLILGARQNLSQEFRDQLSLTGTSHIVAISGLHVLIMIMLTEMILFSVFGLKRNYAFYVTVAIVILFVLLTGGAAPTIRASIMGILLLYAKKIGRLYQSGNVVFLAAAVMLAVNPFLIFWDVGFQLSFLSVLGLVYLSRGAEKLLRKVPDWRFLPLRSSLVITCSAYLVTLPLILYYFGNLSLVGPLVNALILGVLPWTMMLGFIFILLGLAWMVAAKILMWPCWLLLTYMIKVIQVAAHIPFLSFHFANFSLLWVIICYILLISAILIIKKISPRWKK